MSGLFQTNLEYMLNFTTKKPLTMTVRGLGEDL